MKANRTFRYAILIVLFFLPVAFLLLLYPAEHHYNPLDIRTTSVEELQNFTSTSDEPIQLKEHITVLAFLGQSPLEKRTAALNLKELIYDKFVGFKTFQLIVVSPNDVKEEALNQLQQELIQYSELKHFKFVTAAPEAIISLYNSLNVPYTINADYSSDYVFIIDKDRNRRGRTDNRTDTEKEHNEPIYPLEGYNALKVAELKNIMSEDLRILFTEYRQKRKGTFDSNTRRGNNLKAQHEN